MGGGYEILILVPRHVPRTHWRRSQIWPCFWPFPLENVAIPWYQYPFHFGVRYRGGGGGIWNLRILYHAVPNGGGGCYEISNYVPCAEIMVEGRGLLRGAPTPPMGTIYWKVPPTTPTTPTISILLHSIYGIRLKWEPHGDRYVWGEGSIGVQGGELSLIRKGAFLDVPPPEDQEWEKWVDTSSPHAPMVWRSHFPSLLIKCVWYASNTECLRANLRSVLWGVGVKGYPARWWRGALRSFYYKAGLERVVAFKQLREWAVDGKEWRRCRPSA